MGYDNFPLLEASIDHSAAGDNVIVAGVVSQSIYVYSLFLVMGGDSNLTFQSNTIPLDGTLDMLEHGSIVLDFNRRPWFKCADGEAFVINLAPGVHIGGRCYYIQSATDCLGAY